MHKAQTHNDQSSHYYYTVYSQPAQQWREDNNQRDKTSAEVDPQQKLNRARPKTNKPLFYRDPSYNYSLLISI